MKLSPNQSLAGILEPVFAIRTEDDLGIGDAEGVRQMIDWCHRHQLNILQTLPINEVSDDNSPYNALSSLALEPATIAVSPRHIPDLAPGVFAKLAPPELLAELRNGPVNYPGVKKLKRKLLEAAFESFAAHHLNRDSERSRQFDSFQKENAAWLSDYALFRLLMEENGGFPTWDRWTVKHRSPQAARAWLESLPEKRRAELTRKQLFFMYVQWLAFDQWQALKAYGTTRHVYLMGDIPFGVGRFSADVWANRDIFDLDWSGGAPPEKVFKVDAFTEKWGQNWGVPNYRWEELRRRDFDWWRTRVGNIQKVFHLYRIDHVLGFFRIYSFPWTPDRNAEFLPLTEAEAAVKTGGRLPGFKQFPDDTPEHQAANQAQGEEILRVVLEGSGETTVVAEDLGVVPEYVPPTLLKLGIPGFRIPMLFREHDGRYLDPGTYPRLSLAQPTTHDHPPLAAAWAECWRNIDAGKEVAIQRRELRQMLEFAGLKGVEPAREFTDQLHEAFTRRVLQSPSWLAVFQITDVFGMTARFNTPGSVSPTNWTHRLPFSVQELDEDPFLLQQAEMFSRLAKESGRVS
ncbi:MAG TPA: 4-alpha-glucanotransferase [Candidatus Paceibacterota bacterium]|nr:4-alpha-glucanotransferase [Verrucomicrobiota bacterium]HSA11073.1 4-alpha-glucanotransferase [Candidatus Paceibacterota bacterium]